ncbi:hypothetical protein [Pseudaestuariivita sp.]|uniref:hypothetical protein n=1 Tax=Pseudaestuariivita sp. TaxID=2211669 RepID=UPI00405A369A
MTLDPDIALVIGLVLGVFSLPALVTAFAEARAPKVAVLTILISGGLIAFALVTNPGAYSLQNIPNVFVEVIARFI